MGQNLELVFQVFAFNSRYGFGTNMSVIQILADLDLEDLSITYLEGHEGTDFGREK
jgi:hypothetical protein